MFSLTWPAYMQIYWNKRMRLHKKSVQLPEDWFGTPTWPPLHCFGTPTWPPWRHVKTLYWHWKVRPGFLIRGPVSNSEILEKFTALYKMSAFLDYVKIRLLAYFDRLTWTLLSNSLIFWLSLLLSSVTRSVYKTTRICTDQFQFNCYFISKWSYFTLYPKDQIPFLSF